MTKANEVLEEGISTLLNEARRVWEGIDVDRDRVYGVAGGTFTEGGELVVLRAQNSDGTDAVVAVKADEWLLFTLRLLNKRYEKELLAVVTSQGVN